MYDVSIVPLQFLSWPSLLHQHAVTPSLIFNIPISKKLQLFPILISPFFFFVSLCQPSVFLPYAQSPTAHNLSHLNLSILHLSMTTLFLTKQNVSLFPFFWLFSFTNSSTNLGFPITSRELVRANSWFSTMLNKFCFYAMDNLLINAFKSPK